MSAILAGAPRAAARVHAVDRSAMRSERPVYRPPTSAAVRDPFRPPPQPWLAGNRGIEYATGPGDVVAAIGPGVVTFAGPVAGRLVVTVAHPDGLRSSSTAVGALVVRRGDRVVGGQPVGIAAGPFHLGVRRGDRYLDPASLWGTPVGGGRVVLVPDRDPLGAGAPERRRLRSGFLQAVMAPTTPR